MKRIGISVIIFIIFTCAQAQQWSNGNYHHPWSDSILSRLTLRQQIAQMMMVATWSNQGPEHIDEIDNLIQTYGIGGLIFFQGTAMKQAYLTNYYQQNTTVPLMIGIDGEWGLAMRLKELSKFPYQMTLGAARDKDLIYRTGLEMGRQCRRLGVHVNFAPDVDVNTNPENPIIGFRSFGENPHDVEEYGTLMMRGLQDGGVMACAKHFPGHGDSKSDSHLELPLIVHDRERLEDVELHPFRVLFKEGVMSTMVGHLEVPALDSARNRPSSLSRPIVTDLLQKEMDFKGLIFTDALNMKGVSRYYGAGYAEAAAILAGNDILVFPENVPRAIEVIMEEVANGTIDSAEITAHVRKILYFKMLSGLNYYKPIETSTLMKDLENGAANEFNVKAATSGITIVTDQENRLPLPSRTIKRTALWTIGKTGAYVFSDAVQQYQKSDVIFTHRDSGYEVFGIMADSISENYDQVIISLHEWNLWGKKSQFIPQPIVQNIYELADQIPVTVVIFGNIYLLKNLPNLKCAVVAYEDSDPYQRAAAEIIFGIRPALGKLPAMAYTGYYVNQGVMTENRLHRFESADPKTAGFKTDFTRDLNDLLEQTRLSGAAPGGQLLVLKNGRSVYNNAWGNYEYDSSKAVTATDMYDLASITKVAATTLSLMRLCEQGFVRLEAPLYSYLPEFRGTNKEKITIRSLLLHESGLPGWIPFYKDALSVGDLFSEIEDSLHSLQVSEHTWMKPEYREVMWQKIRTCNLEKKGNYHYSDLNMIILAKVVEKVANMSLDAYVTKHFYDPMHLQRTLFHPAQVYEKNEIVPSSVDTVFRKEKLQGYVHDPACAMFGGVSGHAGLFSNATEIAVLFQMLLDRGVWDEKQYLKSSTIKEFTKAGHRKTHRGLGFDKPNYEKGDKANISEIVPSSLFGHTGFTGNWVWADPDNNIVFVFLSNRTFPDEGNKKLIQNNIRTKAIEIVYRAL